MRQAVLTIESPTPAGELAHVTMSFGVAEFPMYASLDALVAAADAALYQAKRSGKNQVEPPLSMRSPARRAPPECR